MWAWLVRCCRGRSCFHDNLYLTTYRPRGLGEMPRLRWGSRYRRQRLTELLDGLDVEGARREVGVRQDEESVVRHRRHLGDHWVGAQELQLLLGRGLAVIH